MQPTLGERYTSFPDLDYGQEEVPSSIAIDWTVENCQLTLDVLILSWASLLKSITGQECPTFCFDGQPIEVDLAAGTFQTIDLDKGMQGHGYYTGIFTINLTLPPPGCNMVVTYDPKRSGGHIISIACTSASYIRQIGRQLTAIIRQQVDWKFGDSRSVDDKLDLSILNPTPELLSGPRLLHELIRPEGDGNNLAIDFLNGNKKRSQMSFELLHLHSTTLSLRLIDALSSLPNPCKENPVIPVLLPQSIDLYVAWLAILKAGAAVCPLNLDVPPERVNFIANDVCADIVVTTQSLVGRLKRLDRPIHIIIAEDVDISIAKIEKFQPPQIHTDHIAYLSYTSGSTGLPKGVAVSHRAATQSLLAHDKWIPPFRRFLQFASPTFDVSIFEIFFPLFRGATLVGCDRNLMLSNLPRIIMELDVDGVELTPTVAGELLRKRAAAPCLKVLLTIGEMLTRHVVDEFGSSPNNDGILYGMYGPTEAAIHCTVLPNIPVGSRVGNIGVPLSTVSAFIISPESPDYRAGDDLDILPIGHVGELAVGGPQLAECYINRHEETERAFLDTKMYGRIYRTGDKARLQPSGNLECLGRISTGQVKLRGQRIELGEIERIIYKVPGVRSVVVSVLEGILVAFVSVEENFPGTIEIRQMCQKWLPKFMTPGDIELLDLPRLPSGKIDKKTLENNYFERRNSQRADLKELDDDIQRKIASCVEDVLNLSVNGSASLAAASLDSLKAIKLTSVLRTAGINIDVLGILEADSIQGIAALSRKHGANALATTSGKFESNDWKRVVNATFDYLKSRGYSVGLVSVIPCSPVQIAMLSESVRDPKSYFNWIELQFHESVRISDIKHAFHEIGLQNEVLRSGFIPIDYPKHPHVQVIWDKLEEDQVQEASELRYDSPFGNESRLLRPFHVDLAKVNGRVQALVHIHHGLYDGWSWDHILSDIERLLSSKTLKTRPQYRLFTDYHLNRISTDDREGAINYWQGQLDGIKPSSWPNFQDTSAVPVSLRTIQRTLDINVQDLDIAVQNLRVSRQTIFQAAFGYLLSAYNGDPDIVFGSVSSGRTLPITDVEDIIGPCMATNPLRINLNQLRTVRDLIGAIHNQNRRSLKHGFLPLSDIKDASGIDPGIPLFDSIFVWQETLNGGKAQSELVKEVKTRDFLEFTMTLELEVKGGFVSTKANFEQSLLPDSQVDVFLDQMEQLASIFISTPEILLCDVNNYLPSRTLSIENADYVRQTGLPGLADGLEKLANLYPERVAIEFLDAFDPSLGTTSITKLTYGDMNNRSNQLANYLRLCGLLPNNLVSIFLEKSINLYVAILAVIKAGCGYVPITPQTPINRVNTIIDEAKCSICITCSPLSLKLGEKQNTKTIAIDTIKFDDFPATRPEVTVSDSSVAYCTFTSGSTGKPKGVLITHHNLQSNIAVLSEIYPNPPESKLLQACSHAFDVSAFEIFYSLTRGLTLCSAINDVLFRDMEQVIRAMDVTHLSLTPTVASLLSPDNIPKVKFLVTAGEAMTEKVFKLWASRGLYQGYGPSETTNICTVKPNLKPTDFTNNIGQPFKNTSAFVISGEDGFTLLPRGAVGEFCFGGDQVGCGYLNMPDLTRSKFISHTQYGKLYRSGDFGRMLPDGSLSFTGRRDDQVKLRGQRIELGEINRVLLEDPDVADCTTLIIADEINENQQLICFWVPAGRHGDNSEAIKDRSEILKLFDHTSARLPGYMIPSMLIPIRAVPITPSGKTDKNELLKHFRTLNPETLQLSSCVTEALRDEREFSDSEMRIAEAVAKVTSTSLEHIALHTSFYSLGLNSISAVSLSRYLKLNGFGQVDVSTIMKYNTVYRLSRNITESSVKLAKKQNLSNIQALFSTEFVEQVRKNVKVFGGRIRKVLPCTPLQEAMLMKRSADNYSAYHNHLLFEVWEVDNLRNAWNTMVQRHDILRSYFASTDHSRFAFAQVVLDSINPSWNEINTTINGLDNLIEEQKRELTKGEKNIVPYSFTILRIAESGSMLFLFLIHHALYDGEAMSQLLEEVELVLSGTSLPPIIPFDLYLEQMVGMDIEEADRFWRSHFSDFSPSHLLDPRKHPGRVVSRKFRTVQTDFNVPLNEVMGACKVVSITLLSLVQAAWSKLLLSYTQKTDLCFGNVFSCRSIPVDGAERIIGPCLNTLPIRIKADSNTMNLDLAKSLQQWNATVIPYQLTSLRRLQSLFSQNNFQLFDTLVLLQNSPRPLNDKLWKLVEEKGDMDFPLVCEIVPNNEIDALRVNIHYDNTQFCFGDVNTMLGDFVGALHDIILYPSGRAMDSNFLDPDLPSFVYELRRRLPQAVREARCPSFVESKEHSLSSDASTSQIRQVREVLSNLSNIERVHITSHTTIFQLGLDSISAVQISARFKDLGYEITVNDVLENTSVGELASLFSRQKDVSGNNLLSFDFESFQSRHWSTVCQQIGVPEKCIESIRPCTPVQSGMLALFTHSEGDLYFNHLTLESTIPIDSQILKAAWITLTEIHEILRTGFIHVNDEEFPFAMITYQSRTFELPWVEEAGLTIKGDQQLSGRKQMSKNAFSHLHQPPWRVSLQQLQSNVLLQFSALHSLYDAQSLKLLVSDLSQLLKGQALSPVIPILPVQNSIISASSRTNKDLECEAFWKELGKDLSITKFPDMSPLHQKKEMHVLVKRCSKTLQSLQEGCRTAGITLQAAGQAAWARILASYTGESKVTCGLVLSGRSTFEAQQAVFPCLTIVPSSYNIEGSNRNLLERVMKLDASLVKYQFTPLSKIHQLIGSGSSLFDTIFVYQKHLSTAENDIWNVYDEDAKTDYPISIELIPNSGRLEFQLTFESDILPERQAEILLRQFDSLLINTVFYLDSPCTYLETGESKDLVSTIAAKEPKIPSSIKLVHQFVEAQAREFPSRIALEFASKIPGTQGLVKRKWTYKELNDASNRYANLLQRNGTSPGNLIGICFDKCPEAYFAILAILKVGCAYVALDPGAPEARKKFILDDSGAKMLLSTAEKKNELKGLPVLILDRPGILDGIPSQPPVLEREIQPQESCYCLYTSGTTGTPKGCEITHDNVIQAMLAFKRLFDGHWDEASRWLQFAAFHFDVSVLEQYWSWSVGICVTACPRDILFEDLPGAIRELEITHIDLTPSLARLLDPKEVPSLRRGVFITGGERLKQEILEAWGEYGVIYNGYGPTEVTIGCTMLPRVPQIGKPSNIGTQFDNVGSFVLKPGTTIPVLRGGVGELCVSGALVGRGYLNRPKLTQEKFQYVKELGERVYRTGDLVRLLYDGSFCFLGRIDDQVKLRGQRLEIGEINQVISNSEEEVREVVTMVLKHPSQSKEQLVSFFATTTSKRSDKMTPRVDFNSGLNKILSKINQACHKTLPGYMVPTHIIPVTVLPLNANNKIDQRQLKGIYEDMTLEEMQRLSSQTRSHSQTLSKDIYTIMALASKITGIEVSAISPWSSIFELGLDSISAIAFSRLLRDSGYKSAQPSLLMKNSTIMALSDALKRTTASDTAKKALYRDSRQRIAAFAHRNIALVAQELRIPLASIEVVAPCTSLQEGMIYRFIESQKPIYFTNFNFELAPTIDVARLRSAWLKTQRVVQILRTKFPLVAGQYSQAILKEDHFPWFELTAFNDIEVENVAKGRYREWCSGPANLTGRVWEAGIVIGPARRWMCLNLFHGLYDGNSLPLMLNVVSQAYIDPVNIPEMPSYFESLVQGPLCKVLGAKEFWLKQLNDPPETLPFMSNTHGDSPLVTTLEIESLSNLEALRRKLDVLEQAVFLACWLRVLEHHLKCVPTVGVVVSGRALDVKDAENIIGPLFNTLPCTISCSNISSMADLVRSCHEYYISTLQYQHTSLRDIVKWLPRRSGTPLFDNLFVFQREPTKRFGSAGALWSSIISHAEPDYPVAFEAQRNQDGSLTITLVTQIGILNPETAQQLTLQFRDILANFLDNPSSKLHLATHGSDESKPQTHHSAGNIESLLDGCISNGSLHPFVWTTVASRLREEVATLAKVDVLAIRETTSIFEIGLDSIDAIKLSSRLAKAGIRLTVTAIMRGRTIKNIVHDAESDEPYGVGEPQMSLATLEIELRNYFDKDACDILQIERILPATPLQEAMIAEMVISDFGRYFNHDVLEIQDYVDIDKLKAAWQKVVDANAILRTSFAEVSDPSLPFTYAQLVHAPGIPIDWCVIDTVGRSIDIIIEEERQKAIATFFMRRPLLKIQLLASENLGRKRHLLLSMPHAMYDGWALDLLHEDIATCYSGRSPNTRGSCDKVLGHILKSTSDLGLQFWKGALSGVCPTAFPKQVDAGGNSSKIHRKEKVLDIPGVDVRSFCKSQSVTLQALGLTCWALVLAGYLKNLDIVFGTVLAGRDIPDANAEEVMFPLMNSVAIRIILHGSRSDMLKYAQETLVSISEHQHIPLRTVKKVSGSGGLNLFDTLFIFQKRSPRNTSLQEQLYESIGGFSDVEYPVCIEMEELDGSILWRVACRDTVLGEPDISRLLDRVNFVFDNIIRRPDSETIDFSDDGISICHCPIFQEWDRNENQNHFEDAEQPDSGFSPLEQEVRAILSSVSNIPVGEISREATLFHLGLDSISAIKVATLLKKKDIILSVSDMLRAGTVQNMAQLARSKQDESPLQDHAKTMKKLLEEVNTQTLLEAHGVKAQNIEKVIPATSGQVYMLNVHQNSNRKLFYPSFFYRVESAVITKSTLSAAWAALINELPILRTQFIPTGKQHLPYIQVVLKDVDNPIIWRQDLKVKRSRILEAHPGQQVPVTLYASQQLDETILMLHIHHALYDAVSLPRMMNMLAEICASPKPNAKLQITSKMDISELVAHQHVNSSLQARKSFWRDYLAPAIDHSEQQQKRTKPHKTKQPLDIDIVQNYRQSLVGGIDKLEKLGRSYGVSVQALFLAIYAKLHYSMTKVDTATSTSSRNFIIGIYLANRSHHLDGLPELVAPTLNIVPLRITLQQEEGQQQSIFDLAQNIQRDLYEVSRVEHSCVSLIEIADWTGITVDTFVNFIKLPDIASEVSGDGSVELTKGMVRIVPWEAGEARADSNCNAETILDNGPEENSNFVKAAQSNQAVSEPSLNNTYTDIFMPGVDVEAAIRDNGLDVGVFSRGDWMSKAEADLMLEELRQDILSIMMHETGIEMKK